MLFSRKNQSTLKSEEKEENCGILTPKAKVLLFHHLSLSTYAWNVTENLGTAYGKSITLDIVHCLSHI
jgi:hypothetical protein